MSASEVERAREAIRVAVSVAVFGDELSLRDSLPPLLAAFEAAVRAEEREKAATVGDADSVNVANLQWQVTELRSALENYGRHHGWCMALLPNSGPVPLPMPCNCGLAAAIRARGTA